MKLISDKLPQQYLRQIAKHQSSDGIHEVIVECAEHWLRGIDYRAPFVGITLIIAQEFSTARAY